VKMVAPQVHKPQRQPITTALRNICRDYPAGGGILRELLQNADDAGAHCVVSSRLLFPNRRLMSYQKFVLDQESYRTEPLPFPGLAEHQGPALLAYNSAIFSEKDFTSISQIGDSLKLNDGSTTGRFGRGFNSVSFTFLMQTA
jgi:sacsin